MESLEALVANILGLSDGDCSQLHSLLLQSEGALDSQGPRLLPFIEQLDPSKHSLGYLYLLEAYTSNISMENVSKIVPVISTFIASCSAGQIRLAPEKFISVCKRLKDEVVKRHSPLMGVAPMRTAVQKLQSSPEHLTALHPDFLLLCVLAKCYKTGLSILEADIYEIDQPKDFFLYCYYGGMICIGQKRFRKAMELLHNVFTAPMSSLNAIAVEAYKKYILVSLICTGQFSATYPKYTSSVAQRNLKNFSQTYSDLASHYGTGKASELEEYIQTHREKFESDNNLGLVKQVMSSLYKRNIQRLTQTYLTLSLQDIANTVQLNTPKDAEMHVLQMIQDGEIFATINQKDGMVSFHEDPEQYKSCRMIDHIDSSIQRIMSLSKKLSSVHEHISCDPAYLGKLGKDRQRFELDDFDSVPQRFNM